MNKFVLVLFLLLNFTIPNLNANTLSLTSANVTIYYEHLCSDSVRFIVNQLQPCYEKLKDYIHVKFVPFGKAESINNGESFECQHGPDECTGNMVQSCALDYLKDPEQQMRFVTCHMKFGRKDLLGRNCCEQIGLDYTIIDECLNKNTCGRELQLQAEIETKKVSPNYVPTIVLNKKFDFEQSRKLEFNFCDKIKELTKNKI
uniref:Putative gamma-interferon inducible lysosomal thiol reductase n=1 Tax=Corethrella appendiculata TaxID=1370023 RepID=U5ETP9_9DIPT